MRPHGLYSPWNSPGQNTGVGSPFPSPGDLPNQGTGPRTPKLQAHSLPAEPPGKPKNTGKGRLSLLQRIFPTQESNRDLLHCRWILYQLSHQGSPIIHEINKSDVWLRADRSTWASLVAQLVKNLPAVQETKVQSLGQDDSLEKEMASHSSSFAWKIPWTEKPGGLQPMGSQRVRHD